MSRARDYRRGKDGRAEDRFAARRRRFAPVLRLLGIEELFDATPRGFREVLWRNKSAEPVLDLEPGVDPVLRAHAGEALRLAGLEVEGFGGVKGRLTFADMYAVILPLRHVLTSLVGEPDICPPVLRLIERAVPELRRVVDAHAVPIYERLGRFIDTAMVLNSRLDGRLYGWGASIGGAAGEKPGICLTVRSAAESEQFRVDGSARPAHRLGCTRGLEGMRWTSCPASVFDGRGDAELSRGGGGGPEHRLPVYVQSHALRSLRERMDLPGMRPWAEYFLAQSMDGAVRSRRRIGGDDVLIEFRVQQYKTGYVVARRVGNRVLVRTFLFLTMAGTPEGDRLARRMRLTRDEAAWLGLHKMSSIQATDLKEDAELTAMLRASGCGPLIDVGPGPVMVPVTAGYAAEVRKFLGIGPAPRAPETVEAADEPDEPGEAAAALGEAA